MIHFSCADFTFPLLPRTAALDVIHAMGFGAVDVGLFERSDHYRTSNLLADPQESAAIVRREFADAQLRISDVFLQIGIDPSEYAANDPDPVARSTNHRTFDRALDFVKGVGATHLTGLPGIPQPTLAPKDAFDLAAEETLWRVGRAAGRGVQYAIEPHLGSICSSPEETLKFLSSVAGLTLTLDYGHFICAGFDSTEVDPLCRYASHMHARGGARGRLQAPVAANTIDFGGMMRHLADCAYSGHIGLEYVWIDWAGCNMTDNVSETLLLRRHLEAQLRA